MCIYDCVYVYVYVIRDICETRAQVYKHKHTPKSYVS